jgi:hypothetical protein
MLWGRRAVTLRRRKRVGDGDLERRHEMTNSRGVLSLRAADTFSTDFCGFIAKTCILLFYFVSASKSPSLLIMNAGRILSFRANSFAPFHCEAGEGRGWGIQTESKGNFCLITVYSHKTLFQPQALRAKKQTFSNKSPSLMLRGGVGVGTNNVPPIPMPIVFCPYHPARQSLSGGFWDYPAIWQVR